MIEGKGFDEFGNVGGWQENVAIGNNGDPSDLIKAYKEHRDSK